MSWKRESIWVKRNNNGRIVSIAEDFEQMERLRMLEQKHREENQRRVTRRKAATSADYVIGD